MRPLDLMARSFLPAALIACNISLARAATPSAVPPPETKASDDKKDAYTDLSSLLDPKASDPGVTGDELLKKWGEDPNMKGFIDSYRFESIQKLIDAGHLDVSKLPPEIQSRPDALKYGAVQYDAKTGAFVGVTVLKENGGISLMPTDAQKAFFADALNTRDQAAAMEAQSRLGLDQATDQNGENLLAKTQNNEVGSSQQAATPPEQALAQGGRAAVSAVHDSNESLAAAAGRSGSGGNGVYGGDTGYTASPGNGLSLASYDKSSNNPSTGGGSLRDSGAVTNSQAPGLDDALAQALRDQKDAWRSGYVASEKKRTVDTANDFANRVVRAYNALEDLAQTMFGGPIDGYKDRSSARFDGGKKKTRNHLNVANGEVGQAEDGTTYSAQLLSANPEIVVKGSGQAEANTAEPSSPIPLDR